MRRVLIGRESAANGASLRPLVVDPDAKSVSVLESDIPLGDAKAVAVQDASAYYGRMELKWDNKGLFKTTASIWRIGLPDLKPEMVCRQAYEFEDQCDRFPMAFIDGRLVVAGRRLHVAATPTGPFEPLGSTLPYPPHQRPLPPTLLNSSHHGILVSMQDGNVYERIVIAPGTQPARDRTR